MRNIFMVLVMAATLLSCKKDRPVADTPSVKTNTAKTASRLAAHEKIKLLKSWSVYAWVYHGAFNKEKAFYAEVANIAYDKQVYVHHKMADGTWTDIPLQYRGPAQEGTEIWGLEAGYGGYSNPYSFFGQDLGNEYVLKYVVNGQTYWDNNNGQNYRVHNPYGSDGAYLRNGIHIMADTYKSRFNGYDNSATIYADLRNLAYAKTVTLVYSTDDWRTVKYAPLNYHAYYSTGSGSNLANPNSSGIERWSVTLRLDPAVSKIDYALSYRVAGSEYWDNHFGRNHTLQRN